MTKNGPMSLQQECYFKFQNGWDTAEIAKAKQIGEGWVCDMIKEERELRKAQRMLKMGDEHRRG